VGLDTCECTKQKVMRFCAQLNPSTCKGTWRQKITLSPENSGISVTSKCGGREKEWLKQQCDMPMDTQLEKVASDWLFFCVCVISWCTDFYQSARKHYQQEPIQYNKSNILRKNKALDLANFVFT